MNDCCSLDNTKAFDLMIIGGGSAGFAAAIKASQLNKKVARSEERRVWKEFIYRW